MSSFPAYAVVLLDIAIDKPLDYGIPTELMAVIEKGCRVEVPVRGKPQGGYVIEVKPKADYATVQPIHKLLNDTPVITPDLFKLALWISHYYYTPLRQVLKMMIPASLRQVKQAKEQLYVMRGKTREQLREQCEKIRNKKSAQANVLDVMLQVTKGILLSELLEKTQGSRSPIDTLAKEGWLVLDIIRIDRSPLLNEEYFRTQPKTLNGEQQISLDKICSAIEKNTFETHLIYGITGSGKTEVYLQAIDCVLKQGKGAIMLIPEISLTEQTVHRFRSRFEGQIAVLHHRLSHGERYDEWHRIRNGTAKIVIGARSAVFSPVVNLGLIIVDEEHEGSYKQTDEAPCYHARDVAVMRGKLTESVVVLGSATPSLESYANAQKGKYELSKLTSRADTASLPHVTIVDMRKEFEKAKGFTTFSESLLSGIQKRQEKGEQTILFLNRRGYHTMLVCQPCGKAVGCQHCDTSLTFHSRDNRLSCHLCGYTVSPPPSQCPTCSASDPMKFRGVGTEQVEKALHAIFPEILTLRLDADTTKHKGSHQKLLRQFGTGKADVLIGTQMIAKGLHFPEVTLVGVLNSDSALNIPDFRASETVFQLITQVAGRAGRGVISGEVIVQTSMPEHSIISHATKQDYESFFEEEISVRKEFGFPPYAQMAKISFSGENESFVQRFAENYRQALVPHLRQEWNIHPVIPAGHARVKDRYRFQFLIRGPSMGPIHAALACVQQSIRPPSKIRVSIDINPLSTFF